MTELLSDARRAHLRSISRLGGLAFVVKQDAPESIARARAAYKDSFARGHACKVCPPVRLPDDLTDEARSQKAAALRRSHYHRLSLAARRRRLPGGTT